MQRDPQHSDRKKFHENRSSSYEVVTREETKSLKIRKGGCRENIKTRKRSSTLETREKKGGKRN